MNNQLEAMSDPQLVLQGIVPFVVGSDHRYI